MCAYEEEKGESADCDDDLYVLCAQERLWSHTTVGAQAVGVSNTSAFVGAFSWPKRLARRQRAIAHNETAAMRCKIDMSR